ncbi:S-phase kinase-associated protein 2 [Frankliniella fusca]|uniref:S-phase kinase-associated protein 2 n=1 Tax=Frankliniella fusca TaxID=407009 RepID=A0AAE1HP02_9NEOP|nr:S-phase kinase-associated protein 2 [Frankliniella fusca]
MTNFLSGLRCSQSQCRISINKSSESVRKTCCHNLSLWQQVNERLLLSSVVRLLTVMDHLLDLFMARMAANEFYATDSESGDSEDLDGADLEDDIASNCSVYGSTTSNEGDTHEEYDDLEDEDCGNNNDDSVLDEMNDEHDYAGNDQLMELDVNIDHQLVLPQIPQIDGFLHFGQNYDNEWNAVQNGYVNHEHDYAHDGQRDGVVVEVHPVNSQLPHSGAFASINSMLSSESQSFPAFEDVQLGKDTVQVPPFQLCHYYRPTNSHPKLSSSESAETSLGHGIKRDTGRECSELVEVKRVKNEECPPQAIGAEITVRTEESSISEFLGDKQYPNMNSVSDDILLEIFSKLGVNSLINIAPVCKRWYELSKHKSLWLREDVVCDPYRVHQFLRHVRAAKYLRTVDVSDIHAAHGDVLLTLLNGPKNVRRFSCFCVAHPRVIVELLERYQETLEELNISISDERLSYGEGGTFKDGVKIRPGYLLKLISEMKNLKVIRFTGSMPSIGHHQGRVNPKWYFGELESPELKLQAIAMKIENPREILVQKFIIPFLKSKIPFLKELRLTSDIWKHKDVQEIVRNCDKLEALVRFPIDSLHALENCKQQFFIDFILGSWIDFQKIQRDLIGYKGLSHIHEVSLRFCDQLSIKSDEQIPDTRLETFLPMLAGRLHSCKRVHIYRWDAAPPFVESVHSTCALAKFLFALRRTLEEVHISDAFRGGRHFPQLMKAIRESVPHLKSRGIAVNRLGNRGLLFSVRRKSDSVISNTGPLLLEHGRIEFANHGPN